MSLFLTEDTYVEIEIKKKKKKKKNENTWGMEYFVRNVHRTVVFNH